MPKQVGKSLGRNKISWSLKSIFPKIFNNHKQKNSNFTVEYPGRYHLNKGNKVTNIDNMQPLRWCTEKGSTRLCYSSDEPQIQGYSTNHLAKTLQKYQGQERQGKTENCHRLEAKETWQLSVMWDVRLDSATEKKKNASRIDTVKINSILYHNCFTFI